jgi:hypothetical protein
MSQDKSGTKADCVCGAYHDFLQNRDYEEQKLQLAVA